AGAERFCKTGDSRAAATGIRGAHARAAARVRRNERDRALDANGDFLAARFEHRIDVRRALVPLQECLRFIRAQSALTLQRLTEMTGAEGQVTSQNRNAFVENIDVRHVVTG